MIMIVDQKFSNDLCGLWVIRHHLGDSCSFLFREVKLHMRSHFLKLVEQFFVWCSYNVMDFVHLIQLVCSWKKRSESQDFEEYTPNAPVVHFVVVIAVGKQALWRSVPPGWNVFSKWWFRVYSSARSKVCQLNCLSCDENIFRFDISMINSISMHMIDCLENLVHHLFYSILRKWCSLSFDGLIHVHLHQFKDKC